MNKKPWNTVEDLLEVQNLVKTFGGLVAVNQVDFCLKRGEILGLIGPNGAGKSTLLNMVGGGIPSDKGSVFFDGRNITKLPAYRRAKIGIGRVFQRNAFFGSFTVMENVIAGLMLHHGSHGFRRSAREKMDIPIAGKMRRKANEILEFVGLVDQSNEKAVNLPHGKLRILSLATALAIEPHMLLLDEPLTGMNARERAIMTALIQRLRETMGISSIIVEHNMKAIMGLCDRLVVLNFGEKIAEGASGSVIQDPQVIHAYLGAAFDDTCH